MFPALLAQTVTTGNFSLDTLVQWGPLAIILVLIILKKLSPGWVVDRLEQEKQEIQAKNEELQAKNDELRDKVESKVLPAIIESTRILAQIVKEEK